MDLPPPDLDPENATISPSVRRDPSEWSEAPLWLRALGSEETWNAVDSLGKLLQSSSTLSASTALVREVPDLELPSTRFVGKWQPTRVALARLGVSFTTATMPEGG